MNFCCATDTETAYCVGFYAGDFIPKIQKLSSILFDIR